MNTAARGRIDLDRVRRHWADILRIVASIYTGTVRVYDVVRMLQRGANPTPLGEAIASYGRIFKSLHILVYIDDELGALGRVVNWIVLWNTRYMNAALDELRGQGRAVLEADVARLSPFVRGHLNVHGKYTFLLPALLAVLRALRNPEDDDGD